MKLYFFSPFFFRNSADSFECAFSCETKQPISSIFCVYLVVYLQTSPLSIKFLSCDRKAPDRFVKVNFVLLIKSIFAFIVVVIVFTDSLRTRLILSFLKSVN